MSDQTVAARIKRLLASAHDVADTTILQLARILSTAAGIEATTRTLYYLLILTHSQLTNSLSKQYERLALDLISKTSGQMLPGETVVASIEPPRTRLSETCMGVRSLAEATGDVRVFLRLWRLIGLHEQARSTAEKPPRDPIIKTLVWARIGTEAVFQIFENGAYLASKGVLRGDGWTARESRWWVWGYRFWAASTALELLRLARIRQLRFNEDFGAQSKEVSIQSKAVERRWWRDLLVSAPWFPLTLHWATETPSFSLLRESWVGALGTVSGVALLRDMWT